MSTTATDVNLALFLDEYDWMTEDEALELFNLYHGDRAMYQAADRAENHAEHAAAIRQSAEALLQAIGQLGAHETVSLAWPGCDLGRLVRDVDGLSWQAAILIHDPNARRTPENLLLRRLLLLYEARTGQSATPGIPHAIALDDENFSAFARAYSRSHGIHMPATAIEQVVASRRRHRRGS